MDDAPLLDVSDEAESFSNHFVRVDGTLTVASLMKTYPRAPFPCTLGVVSFLFPAQQRSHASRAVIQKAKFPNWCLTWSRTKFSASCRQLPQTRLAWSGMYA